MKLDSESTKLVLMHLSMFLLTFCALALVLLKAKGLILISWGFIAFTIIVYILPGCMYCFAKITRALIHDAIKERESGGKKNGQ